MGKRILFLLLAMLAGTLPLSAQTRSDATTEALAGLSAPGKADSFLDDRVPVPETQWGLDAALARQYQDLAGGAPIVPGNRVEAFLASPDDAMDARVELIERAQHHIHLCTFTYHDDPTANAVLQALKDAGARGVMVRILVDAAGGRHHLREMIERLGGAPGIQVVRFNASKNPLKANYRMHRKMLIVDGTDLVLGGRNYGDSYYDGAAQEQSYLDFDLWVSGPVVAEAEKIFFNDWALTLAHQRQASRELRHLHRRRPVFFTAAHPEIGDDLEALRAVPLLRPFTEYPYFTPGPPTGGVPMQVVANYPFVWRKSKRDTPFDPILPVFDAVIADARDHVRISSPYFIPPRAFRHNMADRAKNDHADGAPAPEIEILKNSKATIDGMKVQYWAGMRGLKRLARSGVRVYEYQPQAPAGNEALHMKGMTADGWFLSIGSHNFDYRGSVFNAEVVLNVYSPEHAEAWSAYFDDLKTAYFREVPPEEVIREGSGIRPWFWYRFRRLF